MGKTVVSYLPGSVFGSGMLPCLTSSPTGNIMLALKTPLMPGLVTLYTITAHNHYIL